MDKLLLSRWFWWVLLLPLALALVRVVDTVFYDPSALGPDPAQALVDLFGTIALWFLCFVLLVTPLQALIKARWLLRQRRAVGVACFCYAFEVGVGPLVRVWEIGIEVEFEEPLVDVEDSVEGEA